MEKIPVAIIGRVSMAKQETDRQISELTTYAEKMNYRVVEICNETVSGRADESARFGLHRIVELAASGEIKKVLVHEISRLSRRNSITHKFVETLEEFGVSLYWHAQGLETLLSNGKRNPAAGIMIALLAEISRNEVEDLRTRIMSGLDEARRKGIKLGRPEGTTLDREVFLQKHKDIVRLLKAGQSIRNTSKITSKGISTVQRVKFAL